MALKLNHRFSHETIFSKQLTINLDTSTLHADEQNTQIHAEHNTKQGRKRIPDISVYQERQLNLKWRDLSNPFYIECKLGRKYRKNGKGKSALKQIQHNLMQLLKYNYIEDSVQLKDLDKYGDRHVAITTPKLLKEEVDFKDFQQGYVNLAQLERTLWKLGLGLFLRTDSNQFQIRFNEQEVATIYGF